MKFSCIFTHFSTLSSKENKEVLTKNNFFVSKEEETAIQTTTPSIALHNQEAIHIPANTTLADGTPIQTVRDITKYAFSFMTSDGTIVVPTYEANETGVSDITLFLNVYQYPLIFCFFK